MIFDYISYNYLEISCTFSSALQSILEGVDYLYYTLFQIILDSFFESDLQDVRKTSYVRKTRPSTFQLSLQLVSQLL